MKCKFNATSRDRRVGLIFRREAGAKGGHRVDISDRLPAVGSYVRAQAGTFQQPLDDLPVDDVVLHNQNPPVVPREPPGDGGLRLRFRLLRAGTCQGIEQLRLTYRLTETCMDDALVGLLLCNL